ncbi:Formin-like protein 1 [Capsicum baccatum]|uniref:Formin-like protein 1 n=1 Tax=Capsicum baccatum TaxID=33114 RepID=A0A2G2WCS5_CAPBA|nr:Formin-like protein 1 [Capsicum baccatum]
MANVPIFVESPSLSSSLSPRSLLSPERYSTRRMDSSPGIFNFLEQDVQFPERNRNHIQHATPASVPPPLCPPTPLPPRSLVLKNPLKSIGFESPVLVSPMELPSISEHVEKNDKKTEEPKPKLKTLHWNKVRASLDRKMEWYQLKSSSFKLNEEMIETLFVVKAPTLNTNDTARRFVPSPNQENRVLDPKKAQNIAIFLRALNVTTEKICEALLEVNAEIIGTELLKILLEMAPSKDKEHKLKEYKDDSPARKLIERGCLSFLSHIRNTNVVSPPSLDSVCVVREFMDVFPTDLPGIPPDLDIDFSIDVELSTKPISIPPYRMALTELKELNDQLEELLYKGFIRPSVSP